MRLKCNSDWNSNSTGSYSASNTFWAFFHLFSSFLGVFKSEAVKLWRIVFLLTCSHILFLIIGHNEPSVCRSHLNVGGDAASFSWRPLLGFCSFQQQNLILANMATQGYCPTIFKLLSSFTVFVHETYMIDVCPFSLKLCITPAFFLARAVYPSLQIFIIFFFLTDAHVLAWSLVNHNNNNETPWFKQKLKLPRRPRKNRW